MKALIAFVLILAVIVTVGTANENAFLGHTTDFYRVGHSVYKPSVGAEVVAAREVSGGYELRSRYKLSLNNPDRCNSVYISHVTVRSNTVDAHITPQVTLDETRCSGDTCMQTMTISMKPISLPRGVNAMQRERHGMVELNFHINGMCGKQNHLRERELSWASVRVRYDYNGLGIQRSAELAQEHSQKKRGINVPLRQLGRRDAIPCMVDADCENVFTCLNSASCNGTTNLCYAPVINASICTAKDDMCGSYTCDPLNTTAIVDADGCVADFEPIGTECDLPTGMDALPIQGVDEVGQCDGIGQCQLMFADEDIANADDDDNYTDDAVGATDSSSNEDPSTNDDDDGDDDDEISTGDFEYRNNFIVGLNNQRIVHEEDSDAKSNDFEISQLRNFDGRYIAVPWIFADDEESPNYIPRQRLVENEALVDDEEDDDNKYELLSAGLFDCGVAPLLYSDGVPIPPCGGNATNPTLGGLFINPDDDDDTGSSTNPNPRICSPICFCDVVEYAGKNFSFPKVCTQGYFPEGRKTDRESTLIVGALLLVITTFVLMLVVLLYAMQIFHFYYAKTLLLPDNSKAVFGKLFSFKGSIGGSSVEGSLDLPLNAEFESDILDSDEEE